MKSSQFASHGYSPTASSSEGLLVPTFRPTALAALLLTGMVGLPAVASPIAVHLGDTLNIQFQGVNPGHGSAGMYNWTSGSTTYDGLVYSNPATNNFVTFCIEQSQYVGSGMNGYQLVALEQAPTGSHMSPATADNLRAMWAEYFDDVNTADEAAAFQNAVWWLLAHPNATHSDLTTAGGYLAGWGSGRASLAVLTDGHLQDQLVQVKPEALETPEPGLLALGLLVLPAVYLRRKLAKA